MDFQNKIMNYNCTNQSIKSQNTAIETGKAAGEKVADTEAILEKYGKKKRK